MVDEHGGHHLVAKVLQSVKLASDTKWMWNTLQKVAVAIREVLAIFIHWFTWFRFVASLKHAVELQGLRAALDSKPYLDQISFVGWFTQCLGKIDRLGAGCACHGMGGTHVQCCRKGRRLDDAWPWLFEALDVNAGDAEAWGPQNFPNSPQEFVDGCVGAVRLVAACAKVKCDYLQRLPWLIARMDSVEAARGVLHQFHSAPLADHEAITREWLMEGTVVRRQVDAFIAGNEMGSELRQVIDLVRNIPFDDSKGEGPHASFPESARALATVHGTGMLQQRGCGRTSRQWTTCKQRQEQTCSSCGTNGQRSSR